ncbi:hypothetical protein [Acidithiobacillus thiooxidans]|uniref:hypothetical protein n=1 Tax=Acidithiobacillus thiooxidans TaxID=930 RepID=UPI001C070F96|nr:hypothetical protein [Acidithiobacillus thiooxidans]MBU2843570.1 hypothetical protein [Acidithiobacillus thiooxidans]
MLMLQSTKRKGAAIASLFSALRNVGFAAIAQSKPVPNQKAKKQKAVQKQKRRRLAPCLFNIVPMQGSNGLRRCAHASKFVPE